MPRAFTCNDCYFRQHDVCALPRTEPCPTFRATRRGRMAAPSQAPLVEVRPVPEGALVAGGALSGGRVR